MANKIMLLGDTNEEHEVGDNKCSNCWPDYPKECICGGLIHASFGDENMDCDYWLYEACDKCGSFYEIKD